MIEKLKKSNGMKGYIDNEGVYYDDKIEYIQVGIFDFCGCGEPSKNLIYIYDMLLKSDIENRKLEYMDDDAYVFFLYWADKEELIEHGSSIGGSWLTDKGKEVIKDIEIILEEEKNE